MPVKSERNTPTLEVLLPGESGTLPLHALAVDQVLQCRPVRTFRWHRGQRHFPGWYWSATDGTHVTYESRLELARLVLADFDPRVRAIRSQPFRLTYLDADGRTRRHVPDFALVHHDDSIRIVNVKPADRLTDATIRAVLDGAHAVLESCGIDTEIWSGEHPLVMANIAFLSAYRNPRLFDTNEVEEMRAVMRRGMTIEEAVSAAAAVGVSNPRPILLHLVWGHRANVDLMKPLQPDSRLEAS